ncbi:MAG: hypothetical protein ACE14M_16065 [Terriglobales bacterium]
MTRLGNRSARATLVPLAFVLAAFLVFQFWPEGKERKLEAAAPPLHGALVLGITEGGASPNMYRQYQVQLGEGRILLVQKHRIKGPYDRKIELPHRLGAEMSGCANSPLLPSPDSRYTAFCFQRSGESGTRVSKRTFDNDFEVVEATAQRKVLTERLPDDRRIEGMFWSPDSRALAVLSTSRRMGLGPLDLLSAITGRPTPVVTIYLHAYDIQSHRSAEFLVREDADYGSARIIDWQY